MFLLPSSKFKQEGYYNFEQSASGDEAYNDNGLIPRSIRLLKDKYPDIVGHLSTLRSNFFCTKTNKLFCNISLYM